MYITGLFKYINLKNVMPFRPTIVVGSGAVNSSALRNDAHNAYGKH